MTDATPRVAACERLARPLGAEMGHARHVARLCAMLFDVFQPLHGLDGAEEELLRCAAWLHDVGVPMSARTCPAQFTSRDMQV